MDDYDICYECIYAYLSELQMTQFISQWSNVPTKCSLYFTRQQLFSSVMFIYDADNTMQELKATKCAEHGPLIMQVDYCICTL